MAILPISAIDQLQLYRAAFGAEPYPKATIARDLRYSLYYSHPCGTFFTSTVQRAHRGRASYS
jgi:hypothetical protein